jgi:transposase
MFARVKKSGNYHYLQIVENKKVKGKVKQRVLTTLGRMDQLEEKERVETLIRSLARFSQQTLLILSGRSEIDLESRSIGPVLIFERLWQETGLQYIMNRLCQSRKHQINIERALFLTVLHRLMVSGSDRQCERWRRDFQIEGSDSLELHHFYRAMAFVGEPVSDQTLANPFSPRCLKDQIEEELFTTTRNLFSDLQLVFFDTTTLFFQGEGGDTLGQRGFSKDHRPDLHQLVVGVVIDNTGRPICCELWPGNTTDVTTLIPIVRSLQKRFQIKEFCIVADRGMIKKETITWFEQKEQDLKYILGTRMRKVKEIKEKVLAHPGRYHEVYPERVSPEFPAPLKVKEVMIRGKRYIVCLNPRQAWKDAHDREAILTSLEQQLKSGAATLVGNKGYRRYVKIERGSVRVDYDKAKEEARCDGKWVLQTNTDLSADEVALKYKELWMVERLFRDLKSILETRPIYHKCDETIRGHVFCSFLALVLRKELEQRLDAHGLACEWEDIKRDLTALNQVMIEENGHIMLIRSRSQGTCGQVFQAVGVQMPPTITEIT